LPSYHNDPEEEYETHPTTNAPTTPPPPPPLDSDPEPHRENATFFMLTTNSESDIRGTVQSVRELEDRFNHKYNYPWIFLNDQPFSDEFKSCALRSPLSSHPVS
jgi:alpha 1,2-mannosyltransferase